MRITANVVGLDEARMRARAERLRRRLVSGDAEIIVLRSERARGPAHRPQPPREGGAFPREVLFLR